MPYLSGGLGSNQVVVVNAEDTSDPEGAWTSYSADVPEEGQMLIIKTSSGGTMGYIYSESSTTWIAFSGNVNADNVFFTSNVTAAGNYSQVGNITKSNNGTTTLTWSGKSLAEVMTQIFSKELQPLKIDPSVNITLTQAKAYEVGTSVIPTYNATFNAGSYTYGPATEVSCTGWTITDTEGHSSSDASGSFAALTVGDNTRYTITAVATHTEGVKANSNLGNVANPEVKIAAGTKTKTSPAITGYRSFFYGATSSSGIIDSTLIHSLNNGGEYNSGKTLTINAADVPNAARILVAYPATSARPGITNVIMPSTLNADVTTQYIKIGTVMVEGANGYTAVPYNVYKYEPARLDSSEIHKITLG